MEWKYIGEMTYEMYDKSGKVRGRIFQMAISKLWHAAAVIDSKGRAVHDDFKTEDEAKAFVEEETKFFSHDATS